ncbi:MAG TPA: branched-chain amino acid ABC transporter permease [Candidatus Syntrophoarchaeum butanivorans]|nr:branched-chain amino acid ABC transporter permease [Candidatus Syntrophoarchaeum butanivorans]
MTVVEGALVYSNLLVLLALGLTLTYITTGVPNFAQGTFAVFGSYISLTLLRLTGLHPYYSIPLTFMAGSLLGVGTYAVILRPLIRRGATTVILMIATLALDLVLLGLIGAYSGILGSISGRGASKFIFTPLDRDVLGISGIFATSTLVILLLISSLLILLYRTKFGIALRASMENPSLAEIMGINLEYTRAFSWALSGSLAAIAGSLLPFRQEIVPATGAIIIVSIFAASIVGGLSSIFGAIIGGYVIGLSESLITYGLSTIFGSGILLYGKVVSLLILTIMLLIAPEGLVGVKWRRARGVKEGGG